LRKVLLTGAALLAMSAAGYFGWQYWTVGRFQVSTDDAYVQADSTVIAPKISGYLSQVLVEDNQRVKAGQALARIDDRDYRVADDLAQADVLAAQADIGNIDASLNRQVTLIAQAQAVVAVDNANLTFAQQDNSRYTSLAVSGAASVQNAQSATAKRNSTKAELNRDLAAVDAAQKQVDILKAQRLKAEAALKRAQAAQHQAALNLGYATITAPMDGVVGNRTLLVGQYVQAGTPLMAVVPVAGAYIVANFKETQLTHVHKGQKVEIGVDTYPGVTAQGHVDSVAPASGQEFALLPPDNATGNFTKIVQRIPVKIVLDAGSPLNGRIVPGMSVEPTIDTKPHS
jgi:membrane fusion protein (multidrug efflux system)